MISGQLYRQGEETALAEWEDLESVEQCQAKAIEAARAIASPGANVFRLKWSLESTISGETVVRESEMSITINTASSPPLEPGAAASPAAPGEQAEGTGVSSAD